MKRDSAAVTFAITPGGIVVAEVHGMAPSNRPGTWWWFVFGAFLLIGSFFLLEEHRAHVLGVLPYVLGVAALMFCVFGHRHARTWSTHDDTHGGAR